MAHKIAVDFRQFGIKITNRDCLFYVTMRNYDTWSVVACFEYGSHTTALLLSAVLLHGDIVKQIITQQLCHGPFNYASIL